jgi:hypothetical protein
VQVVPPSARGRSASPGRRRPRRPVGATCFGRCGFTLALPYLLDSADHILDGYSVVCRSDAAAMVAACSLGKQGRITMFKLLLCATVLTGTAAAGTLVLLAGAAAAGGAAVVCCCRSSQRAPSSGSAAAAA